MLKPLFTALHSRPLHHSVRFYRPSRLNFSTADTIALETKEIIDKCIHSIRTSKTKFNQIAPLIKLLTAPNTYNYIFDKLEPDLTNLVHTYEGLQLTNNIIKKASKAHIDRLLVQFQDNIALCSHTKLASFAMQNLSKKLCTKSQMDVFVIQEFFDVCEENSDIWTYMTDITRQEWSDLVKKKHLFNMSKFLVENESGATPDSFYEAILDNYEDFITENRHILRLDPDEIGSLKKPQQLLQNTLGLLRTKHKTLSGKIALEIVQLTPEALKNKFFNLEVFEIALKIVKNKPKKDLLKVLEDEFKGSELECDPIGEMRLLIRKSLFKSMGIHLNEE